MHSSAVALGKYNIRCNAVLPGTIMTDINKEDLSDKTKYEGMVKRTALGRLGGECYLLNLVKSIADELCSARRHRRTGRLPVERPCEVYNGGTFAGGRWASGKPAVIVDQV